MWNINLNKLNFVKINNKNMNLNKDIKFNKNICITFM